MLIEFKTSNLRSIATEQSISMLASTDPAHRDHVIEDENLIGRSNLKLLRSVLLYGANASGKSNVCQAIFYMRQIVVHSATSYNEGDSLPGIEPFRLSHTLMSAPTSFEVTVVLDGDVYRYGFETTRHEITREWLYLRRSRSGSQEVPLFERYGQDKERWQFGASFAGKSKHLATYTRGSNCLLLSKGAQEDYAQLRLLYDWFRRRLKVVNMASNPGSLLIKSAEQCHSGLIRKDGLAGVMRVADEGVDSVETETKHYVVSLEVSNVPSNAPRSASSEASREFDRAEFRVLRKSNDDGGLVAFDIDDESNGTKRFLAISGLLIEAFENGQTLVLDELECSLHPLLTRQIVDTINDPELGARGAQFIIATHDSNLFDFELLRRDQYYLVEKGLENQTDVYSLYDLEPKPKGDAAAEKQYLNSRFGGVPPLGNLRLAIANALAPPES